MSREGPHLTLSTQAVLRTLVLEPGRQRYGLELSAESGLPSGPLIPILARLEGIGWLESSWEDIDPRHEGRPRRRCYSLTKNGLESARTALARTFRASSNRHESQTSRRNIMIPMTGVRR